MQLPKTELPTFDGDPLKYWQFIRSFENSVDRVNADSNAKLMRLVQYCSGKALQVVECCLVMSPDAGYARAREMLAERFGNSYVISQAWIQCVSQGEALRTNDVRALQEFADTMRACKETLQAMNMLSEVDTQKSLPKIVERLPGYLQNRWRRQAVTTRRAYGRYPDFAHLVKFVDDAAEEANDPVFGNLQTQTKDTPQTRASMPQ